MELTGLDRPMVRQDIWLDLDESGRIAQGKNKNVRLGRVRSAVGQNTDGQPWSPSQLRGAGPVLIMVGHRYNKETGEGPYSDVKRITKV